MKEDIILEVRNLNVELDGRQILKDLSFEVPRRSVVAILGPNGAGKTVLLKTLLRLLPYQGEVRWQKNTKVGYVPQRLPFIKSVPISVGEFFKLKGIPSKEIARILNLVGVESNILSRKAGEISSGQFQRVLVGWAIAGNPQVLLFDEPFSGIDISGHESIYAVLGKLRREKGLTILLVSHELSIVYKLADKVLCLNGKLLCQGPLKDALTPESLARLYGGEIRFHQHFYGKK